MALKRKLSNTQEKADQNRRKQNSIAQQRDNDTQLVKDNQNFRKRLSRKKKKNGGSKSTIKI